MMLKIGGSAWHCNRSKQTYQLQYLFTGENYDATGCVIHLMEKWKLFSFVECLENQRVGSNVSVVDVLW